MALERAMPAVYPVRPERTPRRQFDKRANSIYIIEQVDAFVNTPLAHYLGDA